MDFQTILLLTLAALLLVTLLLVGGLTLTARAYTTLAGLIHSLFSLVMAELANKSSAPTASSPNQGNDTSVYPTDTEPSESGK